MPKNTKRWYVGPHRPGVTVTLEGRHVTVAYGDPVEVDKATADRLDQVGLDANGDGTCPWASKAPKNTSTSSAEGEEDA